MRSCFQSTTGILKSVRAFLALSLLFLTVAQLMISTSAAQTSIEIAGYVLRVGLEGMTIQSILDDGSIGNTIATLSNFTVEDHSQSQWNIFSKNGIALSPDRQKLAFVASQDGATAYLFMLDLVAGMNNQTQLSFPVGSLPSLIWSPDSSKLFVSPNDGGNTFPRIYDITSNQTLYSFDEYAFSPTWLPDSQRFVYSGPPTCTSDCHSGGDVYLLDLLSETLEALTSIDTDVLGITGQLGLLFVDINGITYDSDLQIVYFVLAEELDTGEPREVMLLSSTDLTGNMTVHADIAALYPEGFSKRVGMIFYRSSDNAVYMIMQTDGITSNDNEFVMFRWSFLRYHPVGELEVIYERDFLSLSDLQLVTAWSVAPDGNHIALGGAYPPTKIGSVTVINLANGHEVWQTNDVGNVCNIYWADNDKVIYGQSDVRTCPLLRDNLPSDRLIQHTLSTNTTTTILDGQGDTLYFISSYPPTPS